MPELQTTKAPVYSFLQGGGQTGALIGSIDWTQSALGPIEDWSQSLRTAVSICLHSGFPMFIWWGQELINIYNDAYSIVAGAKHPEAMGKPGSETWKEIWNIVGPLAELVMQNGTSTLVEDQLLLINRFGYDEETYFTYSYSPIYNEAGNVGGMFCVCTETTEKVRHLKKVEASERNLHQLANSLPQLVWTTDAQGAQLFASKRWKEYTGHEPTGQDTWEQIIHPDDALVINEAFAKSLTSGKTYKAEARLKSKEGKYRWHYVHGEPVKNESGEIEKWIGAYTDIEDKKIAEEFLQLQAQVLESMDEGVSVSDEKGVILFTNPAEDEMFGYNPGELKGQHVTVQNAYDPEENERIVASVIQQLTSTGAWSGEWHNKRKDGTHFYTHSHITAITVGDKKMLVCVQRDISEDKRQREELDLSLERFRIMSDAMPQFVWTAEPSGELNYFNQAVFHYSGLPEAHFMQGGWIDIVHPDDREENIQKWTHAITSGEDFLFEHRFRNYKGEYRWQLSRAVPQKNSEGIIQRWIGTSTDVHNQKLFTKELEQRVRERTTELERSNKELQQFAYIASHDLQEPIRKIKTFSELLRSSLGEIGNKPKNYLDKISASATRMHTLIKDVLSFSQLSKGGEKFVPVDLDQIVAEARNDFELLIEQKAAVIHVTSLPVIEAIPTQMNQLFGNLLGNSLKFSADGRRPQINITSEAADVESLKAHLALNQKLSYIKITVKDNGIGFAQQYAEQIFTIFQRLHDRQSYSGTGIGLALCNRIVTNHHGVIYASSTEGEGAAFIIFLPKTQNPSNPVFY